MEEERYTAEELAALFNEWREDEAAAKREDAHANPKEIFRKILDGEMKAPAVENGKENRGIER
jgi:hypothetical protein